MEKIAEVEIRDLPNYKDIKIIKISGELDMANSKCIKQMVEPLIEKGFIKLIADFTDLKFIDSTGNLNIINLHVKTKKRGGFFYVFGANKNIKEVFDSVGISKLIPVCQSLQEAIISFKQEAKNNI